MRKAVATPLFLLMLAARTGAAPVAAAGDASISQDARLGSWTITAGGASLTLTAGAGRDFEATRLASPAGTIWLAASGSDMTLTIDGTPKVFGSRADGFAFDRVSTTVAGRSVHLALAYDLPASGLAFTRHYAATSGAPVFETWATVQPMDARSPALANIETVAVVVPAGPIHWVAGLLGDNADVANDLAFTRQDRVLEDGDSLSLGSGGRSSERAIPWLAVDGQGDEFFAALMWSGAWTLDATRHGSTLHLAFGIPATIGTTAARELPHTLLGVAAGALPDASAALQAYVLGGLRNGRPLTPLVTYNTWFAYGTRIDAAAMRSEMLRAAALGVELFVVDAGWYAGAGASGPFDFESGLGAWTADPARFPDGLGALADYAHTLGMKFGIWVEPERTSLALVGGGGVDESWLATRDGSYGSDRAAQICLASPAARQWLLDRLTAFLDAVHPDYLKWDNNFWINCTRDRHGHGAGDGNFAHVNGLYALLSALRERYPEMGIENVSGGGNRLDLGLLRYTDVAWMDDRTAPSVHVRHNLQGLSAVFPPAYLLSFVTNHDDEPVHRGADLPLYVRSRMAGALGLSFTSRVLSDDEAATIAREVSLYKSLRSTLAGASASLLTQQASASGGPAWDALQGTDGATDHVVLYAFQSDPGVDHVSLRPTGLDADTSYEVRSADNGLLGTATGAELMRDGIDMVASSASGAHVVVLTPRPR
jgi:alpha-galactosidase